MRVIHLECNVIVANVFLAKTGDAILMDLGEDLPFEFFTGHGQELEQTDLHVLDGDGVSSVHDGHISLREFDEEVHIPAIRDVVDDVDDG